jgi:phosphoglycolate phosphatase-like HAD superfamily hydrolase
MADLARHYEQMTRAYPEDTLCIVFDIDGTILDMRYMVVHCLIGFDRVHGTEYFRGLTAEDVDVHENRIEDFLKARGLPSNARENILRWYLQHLWEPRSVLAGCRPYRGVLGVIRWFQLQSRTIVALNTGRPEALRDITLQSLNQVGQAYRVAFESSALCMNPNGWNVRVQDAKIEALRDLQDRGYRVVAVVDNEPANLAAMAEADETHEVMFFHADTIFESQRDALPRHVGGGDYALSALIREEDLSQRVLFVWHGINDEANLRQFLTSRVTRAECDVRLDPLDRLVLRHDSFEQTPWSRAEHPFLLEDCLGILKERGRAVALDLKEEGLLDRCLQALVRAGFAESEVSFTGTIDVLNEPAVHQIRSIMPGADITVPAGFLAPLILSGTALIDAVLAELARWGINGLSLAWSTPGIRRVLDELDERGWRVDIFGVDDLETFLEAALLLPRAVVADFNFPDWHYYGRGSGERHAFHRYRLAEETAIGR